MTTHLLNGEETRKQVMAGIDKVVNVVKQTLGPNGRNILIKQSYMSNYGLQYYPTFYTKDGWTVLKSIDLQDSVENMGCDLVKEASGRTVLSAGDATTCTAVLLQAIATLGLELVEAGANPMEIKKGIDAAVIAVVEELKAMAIPVVDDIERIKQIATVSANNDATIGNLIGDAFAKIGKDGVLDIEESKTALTDIKITEGIKLNTGWLSHLFITNHAKHEAELINPYILLYDKKISHLQSTGPNIEAIEPILNQIMAANASLLIICPDADGQALATLAMNTYKGVIKTCIIRCPEMGEMQAESMEDLALLTGAEYLSTEKSLSLNNAKVSQLGKAAKVIISQTQTSIISPEGNKEELALLISKLKEDLKDADPVTTDKIEKRIAKLTGSAAVLYVGAATEPEMKEKAARCDDSYRAVKSALAEGAVVGGGTAFLNCQDKVGELFNNTTDFEKGQNLVYNILSKPLEQICLNAGINPDEIIAEVKKSGDNFGYNGKTGKVENLLDVGVLDPVRALRCALENAASAAGAVITSEGLIV
jgi:chaperonin GroEL